MNSSFHPLVLLPYVYRTAAELLGFSIPFVLPEARIVQCEVTEQGFFCDFLVNQPVDAHVVALIEEKLRAVVKQGGTITTIEMMRENASQFLMAKGQDFRAAQVLQAKSNVVSLFQIDGFSSFSLFSLLSHSNDVGFVRLLNVEDVKIYIKEKGFIKVKRLHGTAAQDKASLKAHIKSLESAKKANYRFLTKESSLFQVKEQISEIACSWLPLGCKLKEIIIGWWKKELQDIGFKLVSSPQLVLYDLISSFGVNESYPLEYEMPFVTLNEIEYVVPPTLAPVHILLFNAESQSVYPKNPVRYAECAQIIPLKSDIILRGMEPPHLVTADFAHIFCDLGDLKEELISSLQFIDRTINMFGFKCEWILHGSLQSSHVQSAKEISKNADKGGIKASKIGLSAIEAFEGAFRACEIEYIRAGKYEGLADAQIMANTQIKAEARIIDSHGRFWSGPFVEVDLNLAKRANLTSGRGRQGSIPIVLAMSLFGSLERFVALLLEHYRGSLPFWLAPELQNNMKHSEPLGSQ